MSRDRGITVIGYVSPYSKHVFDRFHTLGGACEQSMIEVTRRVQDVFEKNNSTFYDMSDITAVGGSDGEMYDHGHFSEKLALRIFIALAQKSAVLGEYADIPFLKQKLYTSGSQFEVF